MPRKRICEECDEPKLLLARVCSACYLRRKRDPNRVGGRREIVDTLTFMTTPVNRTIDKLEAPERSAKEYREMSETPAKIDPRALVLPKAPPGRRAA